MAEILEFQQFAIIINNFVLGWADNFEIQWSGFPHGAHKACNQLKPAKETGTRIDVKETLISLNMLLATRRTKFALVVLNYSVV